MYKGIIQRCDYQKVRIVGAFWRLATTERLSVAEEFLLQETQYAIISGLNNDTYYLV